jgi:glycosyltransferase involved in cell wall biosynthesis
MKILLVADLLIRNYDGCNRTLFNLIDRIKNSRNIQLFIVANQIDGLDDTIPRYQVSGIKIPSSEAYSIAVPTFHDKSLKSIIHEFQPDIIHITSPSILGIYFTNLANKFGIPVSTIYHTNFISYMNYYFKSSILQSIFTGITKFIYRKFYTQCTRILCPSNSMKSQLQDLGIAQKQMSILTRGIDKSIFYASDYKSDLIAQHFGNDNINLVFASRLVWEKNLVMLMELYKYIDEHGLPYNMVIIGDGVAYEKMKAVMPDALFTGSLSQSKMADYFRAADIFIFPSISETYGNVLMEAIACGLPVVAGRGGANQDIVTREDFGFIVEAMDVHEYILAIKKIVKRKLSNRSTLVSHKLIKSWDEINNEFISELEDIIYTNKIA